MQKRRLITDAIVAVILISTIIFSSTLLAIKAVNSTFYRQSRIVSMLVQQDPVNIKKIVFDPQNIEVVVKFAGALTKAYINFELIPLNEASTFVAIFESMNDNIDIKDLEYRRKDLIITGTAETQADYLRFLQTLRDRKYFKDAMGNVYKNTSDKFSFEVICQAKA